MSSCYAMNNLSFSRTGHLFYTEMPNINPFTKHSCPFTTVCPRLLPRMAQIMAVACFKIPPSKSNKVPEAVCYFGWGVFWPEKKHESPPVVMEVAPVLRAPSNRPGHGLLCGKESTPRGVAAFPGRTSTAAISRQHCFSAPKSWNPLDCSNVKTNWCQNISIKNGWNLNTREIAMEFQWLKSNRIHDIPIYLPPITPMTKSKTGWEVHQQKRDSNIFMSSLHFHVSES